MSVKEGDLDFRTSLEIILEPGPFFGERNVVQRMGTAVHKIIHAGQTDFAQPVVFELGDRLADLGPRRRLR
jgi:hypothetical protein